MKNILMYLFIKSMSRTDLIIFTLSTILYMKKKYKLAILLLIDGMIISPIIEMWLGI